MASQADEALETEALIASESPQDDLPKSTSSAMPDLASPNVPSLTARVHKRLSVAELAQVHLADLSYRALQPEDYDEMVALHTEWFPVPYDDAFYTKSVRGEIFTLAAIYNWPSLPETAACESAAGSSDAGPGFVGTSSSASSSSAPPPAAVSNGNTPASGSAIGSSSANGAASSQVSHSGAEGSAASPTQSNHDLLGIVTMSTSCEHHADDIVTILGGDCATICPKKNSSKNLHNIEDPLITSDHCSCNKGGSLAYILTLGIVDQYRRRGLARELLQQLVDHVDLNYPEVQAVYLHVVTYNAAAIQLYESMRFIRLGHFPSFYHLHGKPYDSYLYARYMHGGRPCWKVRLRNFLRLDFNSSWTDWFTSWVSWNLGLNSNERPESVSAKQPADRDGTDTHDGLVSP